MRPQNGIFVEGHSNHWFLQFVISDPAAVAKGLNEVLTVARGMVPNDTVEVVISFGAELATTLLAGAIPANLPVLADIHGPLHSAPAAHVDLVLWIHSDRHDRNFEVATAARRAFAGGGALVDETPGFQYLDSRDLTGFIDGTENPDVDAGRELVVLANGPGAGGTHMFTQRWVHDLDSFAALPVEDQQKIFGRTKTDSIELDPVPEDSHVGRVVTEDENGDELEIYRRSVPYGTSAEAGLQFLAFTGEPAIIDGMLRRVFGLDGPSDRLLSFSRAVNGAYTFAPSSEALAALLQI